MTGMVRMTATPLSLSSGRIVSAAGRTFPVWGGFTTHYTLCIQPRDGCELLPVFQELKRHHDMKEPRPEDFLTEDDYEAAVDAYEAAVYEAEERAIEEYYERKTKSR